MKHHLSRAWLIGLLALPAMATAQRDFSDVEIKSQKVSDAVYMMTGAGGNLGVSAGSDGVFIIDDQYAPLTDKIRAAIARFSDQPVRFVINTHWHGDHVGGNENFGQAGSVIIAHDNVRKRMSRDQFMEHFERQVPAAPAAALPVITFNDGLSLHLNGESVKVRHVANAHTDGDSIIHWPDSNVIHMGDTFFNGTYPFIDVASGGSIGGMIAATGMALELADANTQIIPGHGPLGDRDTLQQFHAMLVQLRDTVKAYKDSGKSLDAAIEDEITAELDRRWGQGFIKPQDIITFVWQSLDK